MTKTPDVLPSLIIWDKSQFPALNCQFHK